MKFTKRITSLLLIFAFAFTSMCTFAQVSSFSDVAADYAHNEAITALVDQGIINGYTDGTFKPENTITRAEFSKILAVASAPSGYNFSATTTTFPDIADMDAEHGWAVPYIAYAVSTKAINGYTDGTFKPGNPVTYAEAIKMIVCTLGYAPVVDLTLDPWYQGYLNIANQIGLTKGAAAVVDAPSNRGIVAHLTYNMLSAPVLVQTGLDALGNPKYEMSTGEGGTFAESKDNATSAEGVVMGVTDYSLDATAVGRNRIQIDNTVMLLDGSISMDTVKSFIGCRVTYSYTGNKEKVTRISRLNGYNSTITVEPSQIENITGSYLEYYPSKTAQKTEKVNFASPLYVIYNGIPVNPSSINDSFKTTYFDVETGSVKFLSNDGNDTNVEVAFIESYETYYTNAPVTDDTQGIVTIYDKNASLTVLPALEIDDDDVEGNVTKVSSKGATPTSASITAIAKDNVVSIAIPYGAAAGKTAKGTSVIISTINVKGDVTGINEDKGTVTIGSNEYELSPYYKLLCTKDSKFVLNTGDNATVRLDHLGRIVYVEKNVTTDPYGLILAVSEGQTMESANTVRVLTGNKAYTDFTLKSEVRLNGTNTDSDTVLTTLQSKLPVPVRYRKSGSQITAIEILSSGEAKAKLKYTSAPAFTSGGSTKFTMNTSGSKATTVYIVPADTTAHNTYRKTSATGYFQNGSSYWVQAFDIEGSAAGLVICYLEIGDVGGAQIGASTPVYMVEGVNQVGEVRKLKYRPIAEKVATGEEPKELLSSDDPSVISKLDSLKAGDFIKFVTEDGVISDVKLVYDSKANSAGTLSTECGTASYGGKLIALSDEGANYFQAILGTVYSQNDKQITIIPELYADSALTGNKITYKWTASQEKDGVLPVHKFDADNSRFIPSSIGALVKIADYEERDPITNEITAESSAKGAKIASQVVAIVMNDNIVGIFLIGK